jgi:hypothetical protein
MSDEQIEVSGHEGRTDAHPAVNHAADHDEHGRDEHGHGGETLGPVDVAAWGAGALGVVLGLVVAVCFVLATGVAGAA